MEWGLDENAIAPSLRNGRNANGQWAKNVVDPLKVEVARANEQFGPGILLP